jgi:hypothetical protein
VHKYNALTPSNAETEFREPDSCQQHGQNMEQLVDDHGNHIGTKHPKGCQHPVLS